MDGLKLTAKVKESLTVNYFESNQVARTPETFLRKSIIFAV